MLKFIKSETFVFEMKVCHGNFASTNQKNITKKMKRFLSLIIVIIAIAIPSFAKNAKDDSSSKPIKLEISQTDNNSDHPVHRAPMRIIIEAFYESETNLINIYYYYCPLNFRGQQKN